MRSDDLRPATFAEEETADLRRQYIRQIVRLTLAFGALFALVFLALAWSGSAVRFGAARVADRAVPTWRVVGTVRNALNQSPVPWASIDDDPMGQPPFYHTDADRNGSYDLLTLAEPHRIRIAAPGYHPTIIGIGRIWFLWLPRGKQTLDVQLYPE